MEVYSSQIPIAYIEIRFSAHATEDPNKVVEASNHILPAQYIDKITLRKDNLRGHHGNPIVMFETKIKGKEIIKAFIQNLASKLNSFDKETLSEQIQRYVDKGSLYIRLDKQAAFHEEFKLQNVDPIHVRIRFKKNKLEDIVEICKKLGIM